MYPFRQFHFLGNIRRTNRTHQPLPTLLQRQCKSFEEKSAGQQPQSSPLPFTHQWKKEENSKATPRFQIRKCTHLPHDPIRSSIKYPSGETPWVSATSGQKSKKRRNHICVKKAQSDRCWACVMNSNNWIKRTIHPPSLACFFISGEWQWCCRVPISSRHQKEAKKKKP